MSKMSPYHKIMRAYRDPRGIRGLRLTPEDVALLGKDDAIETRQQTEREEQCERRGFHRFRGGQCACGEVKFRPCTISLGGPSAMHSEMAENGDLDQHIKERHPEARR